MPPVEKTHSAARERTWISVLFYAFEMAVRDAGMECRLSENAVDRGKGEASIRLLCMFVLVLLATQLVSFYWLYACFLNLDARYEVWFRRLQTRIKSYDGARTKRDTSIQDNSIVRVDELMRFAGENETAKNDSMLTVDELLRMKQNYSSDEWIWLNKYSRVPVSIRGFSILNMLAPHGYQVQRCLFAFDLRFLPRQKRRCAGKVNR